MNDQTALARLEEITLNLEAAVTDQVICPAVGGGLYNRCRGLLRLAQEGLYPPAEALKQAGECARLASGFRPLPRPRRLPTEWRPA